MKYLLIATGVFGAWSAGSWAFIFWHVREHGQYLLREPVKWTITAEFYLACLFAVVCLVAIVAAFILHEKEVNNEKDKTCI